MELRQLRYFLKAAETLNFSEASKELFITQSTLSQQIRQLERELGVSLFQRNSHEVLLTENGEHLLPYARKTIIDADTCVESMNDLKEMIGGTLNIGVTYTFSPLLTDSLLEFMKSYPKVKLNIYYKPMTELMDMLQQREVDFVLAFKPTRRYEHIESHVLFNNRLTVVVNRNHPLASHKSISLSELERYDMALPAIGLQARNTFDVIRSNTDHNYNVRIELNDVSILLKLIRETNYATVLAETTIHDEDGLVGIPLEAGNDNMEGCVHLLKNAYVKNSAREFYRLLSESNSIKKYSALADLI